MASHGVATGAFTISQWPKGDNIWISVVPSSRACRARPSAGGPSELGWPCGGRPGDDAKCGFLGGARSPRPGIWAGRKPGHVMITGRGEGWFLRRGALCAPECLGRTQAPVWHDGREVDEGPVAYRRHARAEPMVSSRACRARPSAGGPSKLGWPCGGNPGTARKAVFRRDALCASG